MKPLYVLFLLCGLNAWAASVQACARILTSGTVNISATGLNTLYHGNELIERFELIVRAFDQNCPFALGVNAYPSSSGGLELSLRAEAKGALLGVSTVAGSEQVTGLISAGSSQRISLYAVLRVSGRLFPIAGTHRFEVPLILTQDQAGRRQIVDESILALEVHIPAVVSLSIDGSQRVEVSLGDLRRGGEVSVPIRIEANHPVSLQVISMHHGFLRHRFLPRERIPYQAWFGNEAIDLGAGAHVVRISLGAQGVYENTLRFYASEQHLATAGDYSDVLLMSVIAN